MAIKVMLKRVPNPGRWPELNEALVELRMLAMSHRGYISGETLLSATEQGATMVISQWTSINGWQEFASSPKRMELLDRIRPMLAEPATMEIWVESPVIG